MAEKPNPNGQLEQGTTPENLAIKPEAQTTEKLPKQLAEIQARIDFQNELIARSMATQKEFMDRLIAKGATPDELEKERLAYVDTMTKYQESLAKFEANYKAEAAKLNTSAAQEGVRQNVEHATRTTAAENQLMGNVIDRAKNAPAMKEKLKEIAAAEGALQEAIARVYLYLSDPRLNSPKTAKLVAEQSYNLAQSAIIEAYSAGKSPEDVIKVYQKEVDELKSNPTYGKAFKSEAPSKRKVEEIIAMLKRSASSDSVDITANADRTLTGQLAADDLRGNLTEKRQVMERARPKPLDDLGALTVDTSKLLTDPEFKQLLDQLVDKGNAPSLEVANSMISLFNIKRDESFEASIIEGMGAKGERITPPVVTVLAYVYGVGSLIKSGLEFAGVMDKPTFIVQQALAGALALGWSLFVGDIRVWRVDVMQGVAMDDLTLYIRYARLKQLMQNAKTSGEAAKYANMATDVGTLIRYRSATARQKVGEAANDGATKGKAREDLANLRLKDTGNIIPLYDEWDSLGHELRRMDPKAPGFAEKYARLEQVEAALRSRGISFDTLRDQMRQAASTTMELNTDKNAATFSAYRDLMAPGDIQDLLKKDGGLESYIDYVKKNTGVFGDQAYSFLERTVANLHATGIKVTLPEMSATTPEAKMAYVKAAVPKLIEQITAFKEGNKTLESHLKTIEKTMEANGGAVWEAYTKVKAINARLAKGEITPGEARTQARDELKPFVNKMADLSAVKNFWLGIASLSIFTGNPQEKAMMNYRFRFEQDMSVEDMQSLFLEMYAATFQDGSLGESGRQLLMLRMQNEAMKDLSQLETTTTTMAQNVDKQQADAESYEKLTKALASSPESGLNKALNGIKGDLDRVYNTFNLLSSMDLETVNDAALRNGVRERFAIFTERTHNILNNKQYSLQALSDKWFGKLADYENASETERQRMESALGVQDVQTALAGDLKAWQESIDAMQTEVTEFLSVKGNAAQREAYNKLNAQEYLRMESGLGFDTEMLKTPEGQKYKEAQAAYKSNVTNINRRLAAFYNVTNYDALTADGRTAASLSATERAQLDNIIVLDQTAFADPSMGTHADAQTFLEGGKMVVDLTPSSPEALARETARYEKMNLHAKAYLELLNLKAMETPLKLSKTENRDRDIVAALVKEGILTQAPGYDRGRHQTLAFGYIGLITPDLISDAAYGKLKIEQGSMTKQQIASLLHTLVLVGGERGRFDRAPEQYETYADLLIHTMKHLDRYRKELPKVEGYKEAMFITNLVQESDTFQILNNMRPVSAADNAPEKFYNLGVRGTGGIVVLDRNRENVFVSTMVREVGGAQLEYKLFMKKQCMNVQVSPEAALSFFRQISYQAKMPKPENLEQKYPQLFPPELKQNPTLHEITEHFVMMQEHAINVSPVLLPFLLSIFHYFFPGKPDIIPPNPNVPTTPPTGNPGKPNTPPPNPNITTPPPATPPASNVAKPTAPPPNPILTGEAAKPAPGVTLDALKRYNR